MKRWYGKLLGAVAGAALLRFTPLFGALIGLLIGHALDAGWFRKPGDDPYAVLGVLTRESVALVPWLAPGVVIGMPLGFYLIRKVDPETFRRVCMSFYAWLVAFGLSRVIDKLALVPTAWAYQLLTLTAIVDAFLLKNFFSRRRAAARAVASPPTDAGLDRAT